MRLPIAVFAAVVVQLQGCGVSSPESINVSLRNGDTYQYPTVGGDEDVARISIQAQHYQTSEMRRDAQTNWVATYVYQPAPGFVGSDHVELELLTGSDGASAPKDLKKVALRFTVSQ